MSWSRVKTLKIPAFRMEKKLSSRKLASVLELDAVVNLENPYLSLTVVTPPSDMSCLKYPHA